MHPFMILIYVLNLTTYKIQMFKRKDHDIFGTSAILQAPRIVNNEKTEPNATFRKKCEQNYNNYNSKLHGKTYEITSQHRDLCMVNESVNFDEDYHHKRRQRQMRSTIFSCENEESPTKKNDNQKQSENCSLVFDSESKCNDGFGRRQTLSRQMNNLPYNSDESKGNSSRLFDLDQRMPKRSENHYQPLIPHQMQWDQHDSVRYGNNAKDKSFPLNQEALDSVSTYFQKEYKQQKEDKKILKDISKETQKNVQEKKPKNTKANQSKKNIPSSSGPVEVQIMKGWESKHMEGLSKFCKLNSTKVLKFQLGEASKCLIVLERKGRWENVVDWMRKDAKMKMRVSNP